MRGLFGRDLFGVVDSYNMSHIAYLQKSIRKHIRVKKSLARMFQDILIFYNHYIDYYRSVIEVLAGLGYQIFQFLKTFQNYFLSISKDDPISNIFGSSR